MKLGQFQSAFSAALFMTGEPHGAHGLAAQPAFAVYRNTVMKGCIDALEANFPSVARLVGSDWFRAAATLHVRADPPRDGCLLHYGAGFADFLTGFEPARELPWLPDVARLDRCWTEAHVAADAPAVDAGWLASLAPEALGLARLAPHPATHWRWFGDAPVHTIWQRNRTGRGLDDDLPWQAEGTLITRPADAVEWCTASRADCAFLDGCAAGRTLGAAAAAALAVQADLDLADLLAKLLRAGALVTVPTFQESPP